VPADEPANAVILPVGRFRNFPGSRALLPAQEVEDDSFLGVGARFRFWPGRLFVDWFRDALFRGGGLRGFLGCRLGGLLASGRFLCCVYRFGGFGYRGDRKFCRHNSPYMDDADDTFITLLGEECDSIVRGISGLDLLGMGSNGLVSDVAHNCTASEGSEE